MYFTYVFHLFTFIGGVYFPERNGNGTVFAVLIVFMNYNLYCIHKEISPTRRLSILSLALRAVAARQTDACMSCYSFAVHMYIYLSAMHAYIS